MASVLSFDPLTGQLNLISLPTTGSGAFVRATSPTLVTPVLGVASATSVALAAGGTISVSFQSGGTSVLLYGTGTTGFKQGWRDDLGLLFFQRSDGTPYFSVGTSNVCLPAGLGFNSSTSPTAFLIGDAANVIAQRNGAAAQIFNLYNTFTTVLTAGEWAKFAWVSNQFRFGAVSGSSSGTDRAASWDYGSKLASAAAAITVPATSGNIVFGGGVQLSNAAVTGLTAGVLAATTNATIVLYDSTGQAYRVPCII